MKDEILEYLKDKNKVSISIIQRDLAMGFIKASKLYEELVNEGYVFKNGEINAYAIYEALYKSPKPVETEKITEEEVYYARILELIDNSPFYPTEQESRDRLATELEIIHREQLSKSIWYCFEIGRFSRDKREPFYLGGTVTSLYVLYVLGVLKYNPMETYCNYQTCLGTKDKPKYVINIDVYTSRSALKLFEKGIETFEETDSMYLIGYKMSGGKLDYQPNEFIVLPNTLEIEKYYDIEKKPDMNRPILVRKTKMGNIGVYIRLFPSNALSMYKVMSTLYPPKKYVTDEELVEDFEYLLDSKKFENSDFALKTYEVMKKPFDLNSVISFYGYTGSSHTTNNPSAIIFSDRDSLFDYLVKRGCFTEEYSFTLMDLVRTGRLIKPEYYNHECDKNRIDEFLPREVIMDMRSTQYLSVRGNAAERAYYYLLLMHYYRYHEKEFLSILQEIGGVNLC